MIEGKEEEEEKNKIKDRRIVWRVKKYEGRDGGRCWMMIVPETILVTQTNFPFAQLHVFPRLLVHSTNERTNERARFTSSPQFVRIGFAESPAHLVCIRRCNEDFLNVSPSIYV